MIMSTQDIQQNDNPAEVYERYLSRPIADPWTRVLIDLANPQSGERVLDLACGTGSVARQVAPMVGSSGQILAVDINPAMLQVGRAQPQPQPAGAVITWQEGDATKLNLPDKDFDLVLCQQGFQFFPNRLASAKEARRVLREEGRAIISVWQALERHPLHEALFTAVAHHLNVSVTDVDVAFSLSNPDELYALLHNAGFDRVETTTRSLSIRMPAPEKFVHYSILGAATSVPAFASMCAPERLALVEKVEKATRLIVERFTYGDSVIFPMEANIAIAT